MARFLIRNLQYEDIPELIALPQSEGREMGLEPEITTWLKVDPSGIFIAESEDGCIAGCCCGIALSDEHGYIGMYVVKQKLRGLGLGRILWNAAISHLGNKNVSLSSADKMLPFYREKAGFSITADWTVDLYTATSPHLPSEHFALPHSFTIVVEPESPFVEHVLSYDSSIHKYDREAIVKATISETGTLTLMAVKQLINGYNCMRTTGYACMKKSMQGHWLIAPVYADDYESAQTLVYGLLNSLSEKERREGVVAKLVSSNYEAAKLFLQFGMKKSQYQLRRLFTKEIFDIPEKRIFALQSSVFCTE